MHCIPVHRGIGLIMPVYWGVTVKAQVLQELRPGSVVKPSDSLNAQFLKSA